MDVYGPEEKRKQYATRSFHSLGDLPVLFSFAISCFSSTELGIFYFAFFGKLFFTTNRIGNRLFWGGVRTVNVPLPLSFSRQ